MKKNNTKYKHQKPLRKKQGISPGTLIYTGKEKPEKIVVTAIHYNEHVFNESEITENQIKKHTGNGNTITWINVEGLTDVSIVEKIGNEFNLHTLLLEDVLNVYQIPKLDDYHESGVFFLTINEFKLINDTCNLEKDQVSLIIGKNFVITFQEKAGDVFEPVRLRLRNAKGTIRKRSADYLAYALMDALVDSYYFILDRYNEELFTIEEAIISNPKNNHLQAIHNLSKNLINFRKAVAPLKDVISKLIKEETPYIEASSKIFLRDLSDHIDQITTTIDTDREFLTTLINTNLSNTNNKMNEVIKVLTVISSIFIPLTFIVGVYGMNFENLPELKSPNGYFILWGIMILIVIVQLFIFKRKKWL